LESKWRFNVWDFGLSNTQALMIARILTGTWAGFLLINNGPGTFAEIATTPVSGQLPVHVIFDTSHLSPGFPWTYDVEPDN